MIAGKQIKVKLNRKIFGSEGIRKIFYSDNLQKYFAKLTL
jgi:hypothetical protein